MPPPSIRRPFPLVYLSFSADHISRSGLFQHIPPALGETLGTILPGPFIFAPLGLAGLLGLLTGEAESRTGLRPLLRFLFLISALSLLLLGLIPSRLGGSAGLLALLISAALQGVFIMGISSILSFWSLRLFPSCPVRSFTAVLILAAAGNAAGPFLAGLAAEKAGTGLVFVLSAGISFLTLAPLTLPQKALDRQG